MLRDNRVFFKRQGTLLDLSPSLSSFGPGNVAALDFTAGDYLYLASFAPFNHRYFNLKTPNAVAAKVSVEIWNGQAWVPAIDVVDETAGAGASLAKSGIISFRPDPDKTSWSSDDTKDMASSGVESLKIFGLFWARFSWDATLTAGTELAYIGHRFSDDAALEGEYPDLARAALKNAWKAGKTSWDEQTIIAAEYIVADLIRKNLGIESADQLLAWDIFEKASVHRTAMIIFKGLGKDYEQNLAAASADYGKAMDLRQFRVDENKDGEEEPRERVKRVEWLSR